MSRYITGVGFALPIAVALTLTACEGAIFPGVPDFQEMCSARQFEGDVFQEFPYEWVEDGHFKNLRFDLTTGTFEMEVEIWNLDSTAQVEYHQGEGCAYRGVIGGHISGARQGGIEWEGQGRVEATSDAPGCPTTVQPLFASLVLSDTCEAMIGQWTHHPTEVGGTGKFISTGVSDVPPPGPDEEPPTPRDETHPPNDPTLTPFPGDDSPPPNDEPSPTPSPF